MIRDATLDRPPGRLVHSRPARPTRNGRGPPFLPYLALRSLLYLGVILLVLIASNLPVGITRADVAFSLALSLGYNLLLGVNDLLGPGVLFAFVAGRYHHPRREERI